jgi:hypothetical protein
LCKEPCPSSIDSCPKNFSLIEFLVDIDLPQSIQIFVKTRDEKKYDFKILETDLTDVLFVKIIIKLDIPEDQLLVYYMGKQLKPKTKISDYKI